MTKFFFPLSSAYSLIAFLTPDVSSFTIYPYSLESSSNRTQVEDGFFETISIFGHLNQNSVLVPLWHQIFNMRQTRWGRSVKGQSFLVKIFAQKKVLGFHLGATLLFQDSVKFFHVLISRIFDLVPWYKYLFRKFWWSTKFMDANVNLDCKFVVAASSKTLVANLLT